MPVTYGSTNLSTLGGANGVSYVSSYVVNRRDNARGTADLIERLMTVEGEIVAGPGLSDTGAATQVLAGINSLKSALASEGLDVVFTNSAGSTVHSMLQANSVGGIRLLGAPTFGSESPTDYATGVKWSFGVSTLEEATNAQAVQEYVETITRTPAAPIYRWSTPIDGPPRRWATGATSVATLIQQGRSMGRNAYLAFPLPVDPTTYDAAQSSTTRMPQRILRGVTWGFPSSWRYVHRASASFADLAPSAGS